MKKYSEMTNGQVCDELAKTLDLQQIEQSNLMIEVALRLNRAADHDRKMLAVIPTFILHYIVDHKRPSDITTFGELYKIVEGFLDLSIKRFDKEGLGNALENTSLINECRLEAKHEVLGES